MGRARYRAARRRRGWRGRCHRIAGSPAGSGAAAPGTGKDQV